jgi:N-acetylglucosaminyldiphosphoundecaprenol N-acetyl-beta-D-mannosaminyltransferase
VVNAAKVVHLRSDVLLRDSLLDCDLIVADGQSVVWASRLVRQPLPERVAGCDLFESLLAVAHRDGRSVYLLGAKPEVLQLLQNRLAERYPGLHIAGCRDGYFTDGESAEIARQIRDSGADMLFLGITSPKKEIFLSTYGDSLGVPIMHGVGGSFDVLAGVTKRAPERWQRMGLEWAYRTLQEPRRMWKRYLTTNTRFMILLGREIIRPTPAYVTSRNRIRPTPGQLQTPRTEHSTIG